MMPSLATVALCTLCAALSAQETASPNRFVPKDSQFVLRMKAPAAWKQQFAATKVAELLHGEALRPLFAELEKGIEKGLETAKASGSAGIDQIEGLLKDYTGECVIAVHVDMADAQKAEEEERPPHLSVLIALAPDGKFDLPALATVIATEAEKNSTDLTDLEVGAQRLRCAAKDASGVVVTMPTMVDHHLVFLAGTDLEHDAAGLLSAEDRSEAVPGPGSLSVHLELGDLLPLMVKGFESATADAELPFAPEAFLRTLGLGCLKAVDLQITAEGQHVQTAVGLVTDGSETGLLGTFLVDQAEPKLLRYLPASAESFTVGALDLHAIERTVKAVLEMAGSEGPSFGDLADSFAENTGLRLQEDLLDHLGTELMLLGDGTSLLAEIGESQQAKKMPDPNAVLSGYCVGIALRDGKGFATSIDKLLRKAGLHAGRKTEDYQGTNVYSMRLGGVLAIEYAITDDVLLLVLGSGEGGHQSLRGVLDAQRNGGAPLPEALQTRLAGLPTGWNGIGTTPIARLVKTIAEAGAAANAARGIKNPNADKVLEAVHTLVNEMHRLGIDDAIGVTYSSSHGTHTIYRW